MDWSQLPGPCRLLIVSHMDCCTRAAWRASNKQASEDVHMVALRMSWRRSANEHLPLVSALITNSVTCLPAALMAKLPLLKTLDCGGMRQLSGLQGIPPTLIALDLTGCGALRDLHGLQHCTPLQALTIEGTTNVKLVNDDFKHWNSVAASLSTITPALGSSLTSLTISFTSYQMQPSPVGVALAALAPLTNLVHLRLCLVLQKQPRYEADCWAVFASILGQMTRLQLLDLGRNGIQSAVTALAQAIGQLNALRSLSLGSNFTGSQPAATAIAQALVSLPTQLTLLDMTNNDIGATGAAALAPVLRAQARTLTSLQMSRNGLGSDGIEALGPALSLCSALTELDLGCNSIGASASTLATALTTSAAPLSSLKLAYNHMGPTAADSLALVLASAARTLTWLALTSGHFGDAGTCTLAPALGSLTALTRLDYGGNFRGPGPEASLALAASFGSLANLQFLGLARNCVGPQGVRALVSALQGMRRLRSWNMYGTSLGSEGAGVLASCLSSLTALQWLNVGRKDAGREGMEQIKEAAKSNPGLMLVESVFE